ncbi:MAG: RNA-binding cell elongation regulator Jag/EloR [Candidatus Dormibacteria bacterium]
MRSSEAAGRTIQEAVATGLAELQLTPDRIRVDVLSDGRAPGSGGQALVRVTELSETALRVRDQVAELVKHMDIDARTFVSNEHDNPDDESQSVYLDIVGDDVGILIGWRGEHLRALQAVANLMANSRGEKVRVLVDVGGYRERREETVRGIALRAARQARITGDRITLDPMPAFERRAIHLALEEDSSVTTESVGEEPARRITIMPVRTGARTSSEPWQ